MTATKPVSNKRIIKRLLIVAGTLALLLLAAHLWYVHNARAVLKQYISDRSHGRIKLELSELEVSLLSKRLQIREADLISTDSLHQPITYHVTFKKLSLNVGSMWALLIQKRLKLDSLRLDDPDIQVIQWRKDTAHSVVKDELSIPEEMGKFYKSLLDALDEFGVRRIIIDNAKVSLISKMKPGSVPVTVSKIFFDLTRDAPPKGSKNRYPFKNQTVELQTFNQFITLPGGRHRISFKSFRLQLLRERIDLDSCTVTAIATDSIKSSYSIFFKKLSLTGVDFNALSTQNVIKADSVYCQEPYFDINLYRSDAIRKKTQLPDADKIIRELTGNLNLAFVGVKNAGIHFDIYGKNKRSFFNNNKDNFEIEGFRINPDSTHPVSIKRFDMTLRDYHLFNEDSSSAYSFDSLHFLNKKVVLSNFEVNSSGGRNKLRNNLDIQVPYFELTDLNWSQLIFEQNLVAREAVLNSPDIHFIRRRAGSAGKKLRLFDVLQNVDSLVTLGNITVKNGHVNMQLGPATSFNVKNIDFNIYSNKLLHSTNKEGLRNAVEHLSFSNAVLRLKDITATLQNARFANDNLAYAEKVLVSSQGNKITATVNKVDIDNMQIDDNAETIDVDGFKWESADVKLNALPVGKKASSSNSSTIHLRNVEGNNTRFNLSAGVTSISTHIRRLNAASLLKKANENVRVEGFRIDGNNLLVNANAAQVTADLYDVSSTGTSSLKNVQVHHIKGRDSLHIHSALVKFNADLNDLIANDIHLGNVYATAPAIQISNRDTAKADAPSADNKAAIRIDELTAIEPSINISTHRNDSVSVISIPYSPNSIVHASGITLSNEAIAIGSMSVNTTAASYKKTTGEVVGVEQGKIDMRISNIALGKKGGNVTWSGSINNLSLENAKGLSIGKTQNNLQFTQASLGNINLSSQSISSFGEIMKVNVSAWLNIPQGQFIDSNTTLKWYNARFANSSKTLRLDSFLYHPSQPLDSVLAHAPYQLDYITLKTGGIIIDGLDVARYQKDSAFIANSITIGHPVLTVYRDKLPPKGPLKKEKLLPVSLIKNVSLPLSIDSVRAVNGVITYSEKNGASRKQGDLLLGNVNAVLSNIKNSNLLTEDSLSLTFRASLMDSAHILVKFKESYIDSFAGFSMQGKIKGADLSILNPVLLPLSNVKISSGTLDSLSFTAVARKDIALGEMDMHYRNLKIKLVKNGDADKATFLQNVASFIANTFIINSNNSKRKGVIFYKHIPTQSVVNYIVRITMAGITSSLGINKTAKLMKQYRKDLKQTAPH
jgi:hypothetical protein